MSMYAEYIREKTSDLITETSRGFIVYRFLEDKRSVYIVDLYIVPEWRNKKEAWSMADEVVTLAKSRGCTRFMAGLVPSNKKSTDSLKVLLAYGLLLDSSSTDFIVLGKDI